MSKVIRAIQKNAKEKLKVSIEEFKGRMFCDMRVYSKGDQGQWRPTKKGIALNGATLGRRDQGLEQA